VELLLHPARGLLAVLPCEKEKRNAMFWAKLHSDTMYSRDISGAAFVPTIYELFNWHQARKYRLRGEYVSVGNQHILLFDAHKPETIISRDIVSSVTGNTYSLHEFDDDGVYIASRSKRFVTALPVSWREGFGENYYRQSYRRIPDSPLDNEVFTYSTEPDIEPTTYDSLSGNIDSLLKDMQKLEVANGS
jgi:hypothetical protein